YFVALVEGGKRPFFSQRDLIGSLEVAVKVRGVIPGVAVSVVADQRNVLAEALLDFQDAAFIERGRSGGVNVGLENCGNRKAVGRNRAWTSRHRSRPVLEWKAVGARNKRSHRRGGQQIRIHRPRLPESVYIDAAGRN